MKFNVIYNEDFPDYKISLEKLEKSLLQNKLKFKSFEHRSMSCYGDISIVVGGDGTLLKTAKYYSDYQIPVLGINIGRLGFLSQSNIDEIDNIIDKLIQNEYHIENRLMLNYKQFYALNDFVVKGASISRTSKFCLEINGLPVCDYIADGLIISTPTGSTAYCLSAGGPVVYPSMHAVIIVPICPHTLNARPIVVPIEEKIIIKTEDELLSVIADGDKIENDVDKVVIRSAEKKARFVFLKQNNFYTVLKDKLHWGIPSCTADIIVS